MIKLMEIVGARCSIKDDRLTIDGSTVNNPEAPYDLVKTMRASLVMDMLRPHFYMKKID